MAPIRKLKANLPTQEGRTLRVGMDVAVTDEFTRLWSDAQFRVILIGEARYHVREEDLTYAWGDL
jgi:hypothetical protein